MQQAEPARSGLAEAGRIVVKIGTRVLTRSSGRIALSRLFAIMESVADLRAAGKQVLVVSSGAVGLGREALGLDRLPAELDERQACAAVGQTRLMGLYEGGFSRLGLRCGQVLLTQGDFDDRLRYLNLRSTLTTLLRHGVIPIINENDAVSTEELAFVEGERRPVFGDNDRLSALVASKLDVGLLVLLTDVEGVFDRDPRKHHDASLLSRVGSEDLDLLAAGGAGSDLGRGGMKSKVEAALVASRAGCHTVITSGLNPSALTRTVLGEPLGTWIPARESPDARRRWIAFAVATRGILRLDDGAVRAIRERGASVLAAGVRECTGDFGKGDVVELRDASDRTIGRGMAYCDAETARTWCSGTPPQGIRNHHALVHRDHLVLES